MNAAQEILQLMNSRRIQNLEYFEKRIPAIYRKYKDFPLSNIRINISPDGQNINLLRNGKPIYKEDYRVDGSNECKTFIQQTPRSTPLRNARLVTKESYRRPRYFQSLARAMIDAIPGANDINAPMLAPDFYPVLVVTGIGLGGHIEALCNEADVRHLILIEPDPEMFAASLYTLDWVSLFKTRTPENNLSISLAVPQHGIIGTDEMFVSIWNTLTKFTPVFPLTAQAYNHLGIKAHGEIIQRINKEVTAFLSGWGNYDDEINQLNHCLHNLTRGSHRLADSISVDQDIPLFIIGAGPSLDTRIETIRELKDKAIIISCGSALKNLHHYGIKPDLHVELESNILMIDTVKEIGDPDWVKDIPIICASQVHPYVLDQFKYSIVYFKSESFTSELFGKGSAKVMLGTPTCVNAALAIANAFSFKNIFLFGTDFGYKDLNKHHAAGSVYETMESMAESMKKKQKGQLVPVESVDGKEMVTTPVLFNAKRTVERITYYRQNSGMKFYNCSDGARIELTEHLSVSELKNLLSAESAPSIDKDSFVKSFYKEQDDLSRSEINKALKKLKSINESFRSRLMKEAFQENLTMDNVVYKISYILDTQLIQPHRSLAYSVRGSLWQLTHIAYTNHLRMEKNASRKELIGILKASINHYLSEFSRQLDVYTKKSFTNDDPWLHKIIEELPDGEKVNIQLKI